MVSVSGPAANLLTVTLRDNKSNRVRIAMFRLVTAKQAGWPVGV